MKSIPDNQLHFHKFGTGKEVLVLLHGFGQTSEIFADWFEELKGSHTIYAIDLYYHGRTHRRDALLHPDEWVSDFEMFLKSQEISSYQMVTFSLGGRFALSLIYYANTKPSKLILIAPDGFIQHFYYRLGTHPLFNPLFKYLMTHPNHFETLVDILVKLGLTSSGMVRFAKKELMTQERRRKVYRTWTYFKPLQLSQKQITKAVKEAPNLSIIIGTKDIIISEKGIKAVLGNSSHIGFHLIPAKHHQMISESKTLVASLLREGNL